MMDTELKNKTGNNTNRYRVILYLNGEGTKKNVSYNSQVGTWQGAKQIKVVVQNRAEALHGLTLSQTAAVILQLLYAGSLRLRALVHGVPWGLSGAMEDSRS